MKKQTFHTSLSLAAAPAALAIALCATPALAQGDTDETAPVVVVTGTRIIAPNVTSVAPITSVSNEDIKLSGTTKVEDLLNSMPQVFAAQSSTLANGATGTAQLDLRGLGPQRTLVLINGRRLMPGDPSSPTSAAADINFIPSSLIQRIDVLTGGASATYGADAVSGVVNFVMDTEFTGFRIDGNYAFYQHNNRNKVTPPLLDARAADFSGFDYPKGSVSDGDQYDITASFGTNFADGDGHLMAYFGYRKANAILQRNRDYSACTIQSATTALNGHADPDAALSCGGSLTNQVGTAVYYASDTSSSTIGALGPGTLTQGQAIRYNYAPLNYFQRPDERYTAGAFADYEVAKEFHPYLEFMFMDDRTLAQIAPSGDFGNTLLINCDNPLMSAEQSAALCSPDNAIRGFVGNFPLAIGLYEGIYGTAAPAPIDFINPVVGAANPTYQKGFFQLLRRNVEGGPRVSDLKHTAFRTVLGTRGELGTAWSYDLYFQYGRTNYSQVYSNEFSVQRLNNALDAVTDPATGDVVCRSVLTGTDPNCRPYDVFGGTPSQESLDYLSATGFQNGYTSEQVISGVISGSLGEYGVQLPWARDGVSVALGVEHRRENLDLQTDNAFTTGDLTGQGAPTLATSGSFKVDDLFGEIEIPIVSETGIYSLGFNGGYRYSHYSTSNGKTYNTDTFKFGVDFAPVRDLRLRGSINRAVRAPNIQELFSPQFVALDGVTDPCAGDTITADDVGCISQGLRIGQTINANPAQQYNGLIGGNPDLLPEVATTKTVGAVFQPGFLPRLTFSVDYFDIKVKNAIQRFGADAIVASCTNDNNPLACSLINRNPAGSLWLSSDGFVRDLPRNIGGVRTTGFEFNADYSYRAGFGTLAASFVGTALSKFETDNGLTEVYDCAGYYGPTCGTPAPKWRHKARVSLNTNFNLGVSLQWRYIGAVDIEAKNPSSSLAGDFYNFGGHLSGQSYIDLALSYRLMDRYSFRLGVNNIFDKEPPLTTTGSSRFGGSQCASVVCNGNVYPGTYDSLGRYIYTSVTLDF